MKICHCDWLNKQVDWQIVEQDKVRWESKTENDGMRQGGISKPPREQDMLEDRMKSHESVSRMSININGLI